MSNDHKDHKSRWTLTRITWISACVLLLILSVSAAFFFWGREVKWMDEKYVADNELWGTFGDFCGGIIGLFLSLYACILMIWTFREQRELTRNTGQSERNMAELQRFNDLFFQLLALYRQQDKELGSSIGTPSYFDTQMGNLRNEFKEYVKYGDAYRYAGDKYLDFYVKNARELAPHFRTLYRIFNLIDHSEIDNDKKLEFAKIARAQLSEGELFFLRYNCMTSYGNKFIEYINKYRLLKHLPFLSLLENKKFRNLLITPDNPRGLDLNVTIYDIGKAIYDRVVGKIPLSRDKIELLSSTKFKIYLIMRNDRNLIVELQKDNGIMKVPQRLKTLNTLNDSQILMLIYTMLREFFIFSNFGNYNPNVVIRKKTRTRDKMTTFWVSVKNDTRLRLSHPAWDKNYGITS